MRDEASSRRRFVKLAGVLAGAGVLGLALGGITARVLGADTTRILTSTTTLQESFTPSPVTTDAQADPQTPTGIETETVYSTQDLTETVTTTEDEVVTYTSTEESTETVTSTSTVTVTDTVPALFSIFWITDTQFLSESNPELYSATTQWIVDNWNTYNGKFVIHTGDVVQDGGVQAEWQNANAAMQSLLLSGIPYTWCAGNHDDLTANDSTSGWMGNQWAAAFDPSQVGPQIDSISYTSWVGDYHEGMNTAATFSANGLNFLVVNLEWNAQSDAFAWLDGILSDPQYASYYVIVAPHAYINADGQAMLESNHVDLTGFLTNLETTLNNFPNVFLTLNGHYASDCGYNTPSPVNNRNELMFDRQDSTDSPSMPLGRCADSTASDPDSEKVGGATVTILTFDTANNQLDVSTYDVYTGTWRQDSDEQYSIQLFSALPSSNA